MSNDSSYGARTCILCFYNPSPEWYINDKSIILSDIPARSNSNCFALDLSRNYHMNVLEWQNCHQFWSSRKRQNTFMTMYMQKRSEKHSSRSISVCSYNIKSFFQRCFTALHGEQMVPKPNLGRPVLGAVAGPRGTTKLRPAWRTTRPATAAADILDLGRSHGTYWYYIYIDIYPPTPAFAKAGAAPGTTAGVEPVFAGLLLPCLLPGTQATALCC